MKYFLAVFLLVFFAGCIVDYRPNLRQPEGVQLLNLIWTADGNFVTVLADSISSDNAFLILRLYDKSGSYLRSFDLPSTTNFNSLWPANDDTSVFFSSSGGLHSVFRYYLNSGIISSVAGGDIYAESSDQRHLFVGPYSYQTQGTNFLIIDISGAKPRLQKSWSDASPSNENGIWIGSNSIGYFRYNSFNLVDFAIVDTNGVKLDSFDVSLFTDLYGTKPYHSPGFIYFAGYNGIAKYDSLRKTSTWLTQDVMYESDISPDGSFVVYEKNGASPDVMIISTKTAISKSLGISSDLLKISPAGDHLAYIDETNSSNEKLVIIPVSAP